MMLSPRANGYSLLDLMVVLWLVGTITAISIPQMLAALDDYRTYGAARYMASRLQEARMEAVARSAHAGLRFASVGESYSFAVYLDGNRNGLLSRDIQRGVDRQIRRREQLSDLFPGTDFGVLPGVAPVDPSGPAPTGDPIKFGASDMVVFTPLGTSTPGSLYIRGRHDRQYAIRVLGDTGRTRILKFDRRRGRWQPL